MTSPGSGSALLRRAVEPSVEGEAHLVELTADHLDELHRLQHELQAVHTVRR